MHQIYQLSHQEAAQMIAAIQTELEKTGEGAAIAVVDAHGDLLAFLRTDGCKLPSIQIAINKAYSAAREGIPSKVLGERSREEGFPMTNFGELRYLTWGGGLPILHQGQVVGAIGVSGLPEARDIELATLGLSVLGS